MDWVRPRILILAANPTLCFTLEEVLRYYDYEVTAATDSAAALALMAQHSFESVLFVLKESGLGGVQSHTTERTDP